MTAPNPLSHLLTDIARLVHIERAAKRVDAVWYGDGTEHELHDALTELHNLVAPPGAIRPSKDVTRQ